MPERLFLIDGSSYIFRAYHAIPLLTNSRGVPTNAVFGFTNMMIKLLREEKPSHAAVVFDAPGETFRDRMFAEYKANREEAPEELRPQFALVRRAVKALNLALVEVPDVEADDVIGTLATAAVERGFEAVLVSGDKDLLQLVRPGLSLLDTMRGRRTGVADIERRFGLSPAQLVDVMALMGDPIDNVPGIRGVGEKTAIALIRRFGSLDGLLARIDEVPGCGIRGAEKIAERLRAEEETVRLSRELVRVRCDLSLGISPESLRYPGPDLKALLALCEELGFGSLARDLEGEAGAALVSLFSSQGEKEAKVRTRPKPFKTQLLPGFEKPEEAKETFERSPRQELSVPEAIRKARVLGISIVSSDEQAMSAKIVAVALAEPGGTSVSFPPSSLGSSLAWLEKDSERTIAGEDLKRALVLLGRAGIELAGSLFDTALASYVLDPSRESHRVSDLTAAFLGAEEARSEEGEAEAAALLAARLVEPMERELRRVGVHSLYHDVEAPLIRVLARMERNGIKVDREVLARLSSEFSARLEQQMKEVFELAGGAFNINSPVQLREVLFDRLKISTRGLRRGKTGFSTDFDTLTKLAELHPLPAKILDYRALSKLKSTYIDPLPGMVNPTTGRIHTSFNQTVTATGRLSSSDPNLQNIPIRTEEGRRIREAFVAEQGSLLLAADYSQIELRLLAHLSQDPTLIEAFHRGEDIHTRTAAEIFGVRADEVDAEMRRQAKVINFGVIYGMGPQRLARELGISVKEANGFIQSYFARYKGVRDYTLRTVQGARKAGYVTTILNRRRYLPELQSSDGGLRQFAERTAINTPVQGSAADLIKLAMVRLDERIGREGLPAKMLLQVHDELVFEVARGEVERVEGVVREEMESVWTLRVPLKVDTACGRNWAQAH